MENGAKILIVDDERVALRNLEHVMKRSGYDVAATQSSANAIKLMRERQFDVVITDLRMEKIDGMEILKRCRELSPDTEVIMITGYATLDSAVDAMKHGAFNYIAKPYKLDEVRKIVGEALEKVRLIRENRELRGQIESYQGQVKIISQDQHMQKLLTTARQIAPTNCNVLIAGESGTGKELLARYIHANSKRADGPFLAVNCGAFTGEMLDNELFGGSGSGAAKLGAVEMASNGTLFLNEITEMPTFIQDKLLSLIKEQTVQRSGGSQPIRVNVRFIAATDKNIQERIKNGTFRQDLNFNLQVMSLHVPPLSQRREDIPLLSLFFLTKYAALMKKKVTNIDDEVMTLLMSYDFPGNVRELENLIERGVVLSNSAAIETGHLPEDLRELSIKTFRKKDGKIPSLEDQEMTYIKWVLNEVGGNKSLAAQILRIDRVSLWRKLKKLGMEEE